jgi:hypothetical protein
MNAELHTLFQADREERIDQPRNRTPEYKAMRERDHQRRLRAAEIIAGGVAVTADDFYYAALLFQHGDTPDEAWQAHTLALAAMTLGRPKARRLGRAATCGTTTEGRGSDPQ